MAKKMLTFATPRVLVLKLGHVVHLAVHDDPGVARGLVLADLGHRVLPELPGRLTEVDSIGGAVCRPGAARGVAVPVLETLCAIVRLRTTPP